jgi:hypothetical protein
VHLSARKIRQLLILGLSLSLFVGWIFLTVPMLSNPAAQSLTLGGVRLHRGSLGGLLCMLGVILTQVAMLLNEYPEPMRRLRIVHIAAIVLCGVAAGVDVVTMMQFAQLPAAIP